MTPSVSFPGTTVERHSPRSHTSCRNPPTSSASSENCSIRIQRAPSSAAAASRDALLRIDIGGRRRFGYELRILQQGARQRLEPGLPGDLRPRAPLRLVGQIQIFEPRLRVGGVERRGQLRRELPLRRDAFDDRGAPIVELSQVRQPLGECAQLRVVEPAGCFLAIAGDEGHGGLVVEQRDRGLDLGHAHLKFVSDSPGNGDHGMVR